MKRSVIRSIGCLVIMSVLLTGGTVNSSTLGVDSLKIALKTGAISRETYVVSSLKAYFSGSQVKSSNAVSTSIRTGRELTLLLKESVQNYDSYSAESKAVVDFFLLRPTSSSNKWPWDSSVPFYLPSDATYYDPPASEYSAIGGKIRIWYVTDAGSVHATTFAFVQDVAQAFEETYQKEISVMGYPAPLSDSGNSDNGGDGKLDVYVMDCGAYSVYGYTMPIVTNSSTTPSYMVVDNDYSPVQFGVTETPQEALDVTVAHEFNHAVQFGINAFADQWICEATSSWMENQVYPSIYDNIQYLNDSDGFFAMTDIPLDSDSQWYNSWIFMKYMELTWNSGIVKTLWTDYLTTTSVGISAVSKVITAQGSNLKQQFTSFVQKNYSQTDFYPDAARYDEVLFANGTGQVLDYSTSTSRNINQVSASVDHLAALYYKYKPGMTFGNGDSDTLLIEARCAIGAINPAVTVRNIDGSYTHESLTLNALNQGYIYISNFNPSTVDEVVLELANYSTSHNTMSAIVSGGLGKTTDITSASTSSSSGGGGGGCFIDTLF